MRSLACSSYNAISSLHSKQILILMERVASGCCQHPAYSVVDVTCLSDAHFEFCWTHSRILCSGYLKRYMRKGWQGKVATHIVGVSSAHAHDHCSTGLHLQKRSSKKKSVRISRWWQQSIKPSMEPSGCGACVTAQVVPPWRWRWSLSLPPHSSATVLAEAFISASLEDCSQLTSFTHLSSPSDTSHWKDFSALQIRSVSLTCTQACSSSHLPSW